MAAKIVDLTTLHWPVYTPELDGDRDNSPDTSELSSLILNSTALVVCAPEYNGVMPLHSTTRLHGYPLSRMIFENCSTIEPFCSQHTVVVVGALSDGYAPPILFPWKQRHWSVHDAQQIETVLSRDHGRSDSTRFAMTCRLICESLVGQRL